jgi:hypothetical protein
MNKDVCMRTAGCRDFDSVPRNAERIRAMRPAFAFRIDNVAVSVSGASIALQGTVEGGAR